MDNEQLELIPTFSSEFLSRHAGKIISDPHFALVELVANSWDAGAKHVTICWPLEEGDEFSIEDDGIGMTTEEFTSRWLQLNYNRLQSQGSKVIFPAKSSNRERVAFGRNDIGRHASFCFSDSYNVSTKKDGIQTDANVQRSSGKSPYEVNILNESKTKEHGTRIYTKAIKNIDTLTSSQVADLIGSRFVSDPEFEIYVNDHHVTFEDLVSLSEEVKVNSELEGIISIRRFDSQRAGRTSKQSGIAWWVKKRLVGKASWDGYDGSLLDARHAEAKRYTYVVQADISTENVKPDWSGFYASSEIDDLRKQVSRIIQDDLRKLTSDVRKERKKAALSASRSTIRRLPTVSQEQIAKFADEVQVQCPTISIRDLQNAVATLAKLEKARTGYQLLDMLSLCDSDDLDNLYLILNEWSVTDAKKVLDELRYRLRSIERLESLVDRKGTDELHELQPLFERGLWIFRPRFESIEFSSNRTISTILKKFLGNIRQGKELTHPAKRPDFLVIPDECSIGTYSCDEFDKNNEVSGLATVIVVELKRGGFTISHSEKDQANRYAREIRKSGKISKSTEIIGYVLGSSVDSEAEEPITEGKTIIYPRSYNAVLRQAHARTFHLLRTISSFEEERDPELREVIDPSQSKLDLDEEWKNSMDA